MRPWLNCETKKVSMQSKKGELVPYYIGVHLTLTYKPKYVMIPNTLTTFCRDCDYHDKCTSNATKLARIETTTEEGDV
jgi:hypothetical protein